MIGPFDFDNPITRSLSQYDNAKQIYTEGLVSGRLGRGRQRKKVIQGVWREAEASPVTICSLVESINPAICVMHTVLLLPPHQRSSAHTLTHMHRLSARARSRTDGHDTLNVFHPSQPHLSTSVPLLLPSHAHINTVVTVTDTNKHRNTHQQLSISMHKHTHTHLALGDAPISPLT